MEAKLRESYGFKGSKNSLATADSQKEMLIKNSQADFDPVLLTVQSQISQLSVK